MHPTTASRHITSLLIASSMSLAIACSPSGGDKAAAPAAATPPGGGAAPAAAPPAPAAAAGPRLTMHIQGGSAHVISLKHDTFEFGPILHGQNHVCGNEAPHELWMIVDDGAVTHSDLPFETPGSHLGSRVYRLTGRTGELDLPSQGKPGMPALATPDGRNQLALVPDLSMFVADPRLDPNWRTKLSARFVLKGGALVVEPPTDEAAQTAQWEFKNHSGASTGLSQNVSDHMVYTVGLSTNEVTLKFDNGRVALAGANIDVTMLTTTRQLLETPSSGTPYEIGMPAHEYCYFYDLLATPVGKEARIVPVLASLGAPVAEGTGIVPGKYCGGARYVER
jgi:hypothetical protein